jgi:hypothetical protein
MRSIVRSSLALVAVLAGCAGGGGPAEVSPETTVITTEPPVPTAPAPGTLPAESADPPWVRMSATITSPDGDAAEFAADGRSGGSGPFEEFASCSGLRDAIGAYSVFVSVADGALSVWTADRVDAAGVFEADVRLERPGSAPVSAAGTIEVSDGLQSGRFLAYPAEGGRIEGTFACTGSEVPSPLVVGPADGVLDTVEVFALLGEGETERVVGLAVDASDPDVEVRCPAVEDGASGDVVVRVVGDERVGAITEFEISVAPRPVVRLRVGEQFYELTEVSTVVEPDGRSGVFGAAADGVSVDGAFRCS